MFSCSRCDGVFEMMLFELLVGSGRVSILSCMSFYRSVLSYFDCSAVFGSGNDW